MRRPVTFDEVITSLYEAAADPTLWRPALASMAKLFAPSFAGHFFSWDKAKNVAYTEVDREELAAANQAYAGYYAGIDPRAAMVAKWPIGKPFACHHHFDDAYVAGSEFYQDFMIKIGGRYVAGVKLFESDRLLTITSVHRNALQGPFEANDLKLLKRLQPHLTQAMGLFHKFNDLKSERDRSTAALDHFTSGVILVSREGKILDLNVTAESYLQAGDLLRIRDGKIEAARHELASKLNQLIVEACDAPGGRSCVPGGVLRLDRGSGSYLMVLVTPLRQSRRELVTRAHPAALLFITDSTAQPRIPAVWLQQLYGLTPAEAGVALALSTGATVEEIAERNGVSKNTVRVQTQSILSKTGARRQAELVSIISQIPQARL